MGSSSSYITDKNGEIIQHTEYIAFGETFVDEHSVSNKQPYLFNGKELDFETGLYYYGARYYDAKTSLWLNTDPLSGYNPILETEHYIDGQHNGGVHNPMNLNTYTYTYQNPIVFVDPNGKQNYFSGPHKHGSSTFTVWEVNINERLVSYNQRSGRYEERNLGTRIGYRMRSSDSKLNKYMGNEVSYSIKDKNGKWSQISSQSTGRSDVSGLINNKYNPVDMEKVESTRKAGEMMDSYGDKASKAGIAMGNPILGVAGATVSLLGNGMQIYSDFQTGDYKSAGTKTGVFIGSDILNRAGDAFIDSKIKNPLLNKGSKLFLQESLRQGGNKVSDNIDKNGK
ncbi:hypothetical protein BPO_0250 [Bergeyella porcorum]|uniref:RHS repeat-associated core domain-containing protein n=1 Tax=Bergeyella porcorum TaxID=1735111 RepID=A0AAU0F2D5_9FLAO